MARKPVIDALSISQTHVISTLVHINNSLYNTSEHLGSLVPLLLSSASVEDAKKTSALCEVLIDHLVATSTALKAAISSVNSSLSPAESVPQKPH
jgi:hypothetical protein